MPHDIAVLARALADQAEAVCRHYLSNGRRQGGYWTVGDCMNTPGRSLYVRLKGSGRRAAGKWTDAATGEHGDLLDLIQATCRLSGFHEAAAEARRFLALPTLNSRPDHTWPSSSGRKDSAEPARRLFAASMPIAGTIAAAYLHRRGILLQGDETSLGFHPACHYRASPADPVQTLPALIAAVTGGNGRVTGIQRTWLDAFTAGKAALATPRRAMGDLLGHAVRIGRVHDTLCAGEGVETMLSLRTALPRLPVAAALSAAHLAALAFPADLQRLYIACDSDAAGRRAAATLSARARACGIEPLLLTPMQGDFNDDLRQCGAPALTRTIRAQLAPDDADHWLASESAGRDNRHA